MLSYPSISRDDFDWVQAVRAKHDELYYEIVGPHFTIVFPVEGMSREKFCEHVRGQACGVRRIPFVLRCAIIVKDHFSEYTHVFLVPDEGYSDIVKLHDRLYTGPLTSELRLDIPFTPHIGVANAVDARKCKELADELNNEGFCIDGLISDLDTANYEDDRLETFERIELGGHSQ